MAADRHTTPHYSGTPRTDAVGSKWAKIGEAHPSGPLLDEHIEIYALARQLEGELARLEMQNFDHKTAIAALQSAVAACTDELNGIFNGVLNASSWEECKRRIVHDLAPTVSEIVAAAAVVPSATAPRDVYCHECSKAGGADKPIYHLPPACGSNATDSRTVPE